MNTAESPPEGIDPDTPSAARVYDYYLGGAHNFAADRRVAEQVFAVDPNAALMAQTNRAFLRRAVRYLVGAGVHQFLDIGSGIPTVGHVHEIAQDAASDARVVYVDIDPIAVAHSRQILAGSDGAVAIQEDLRRPQRILAHPEVRRMFDFTQPVAVLLVALLHHIPDADDPAGLAARLLHPLASGSYVAVSHGTEDGSADMTAVREIYGRSGIALAWRTRKEVEALFGECVLVPPGVVWAPAWHPESTHDAPVEDPGASAIYAGVGRKP